MGASDMGAPDMGVPRADLTPNGSIAIATTAKAADEAAVHASHPTLGSQIGRALLQGALHDLQLDLDLDDSAPPTSTIYFSNATLLSIGASRALIGLIGLRTSLPQSSAAATAAQERGGSADAHGAAGGRGRAGGAAARGEESIPSRAQSVLPQDAFDVTSDYSRLDHTPDEGDGGDGRSRPEPLVINQRLAELALWVVDLERLQLETLAWHRQLEPHRLKPPPSHRPLGLEWVRESWERTEQGVRLTNQPLEEHLAQGILSFSLDQFNAFGVDALSRDSFVMVDGERFVPATPRFTANLRHSNATALIDGPATIYPSETRGWIAATIDLTVRSAGLTSDLLAARLGALHAMGLLALVSLTHRLARLLDTTARLIITPCGGCGGCARVLGLYIRTTLSLMLLAGPLALLLELIDKLANVSVPLPVLLVQRLFLSLVLLGVCGVGRPSRAHIYTPERQQHMQNKLLHARDRFASRRRAGPSPGR